MFVLVNFEYRLQSQDGFTLRGSTHAQVFGDKEGDIIQYDIRRLGSSVGRGCPQSLPILPEPNGLSGAQLQM